MAIETIEEFVHSADGSFVSKDPFAPYVTVGTKVKIIKANGEIGIDKKFIGKIGEVDRYCAEENKHRNPKNVIISMADPTYPEEGECTWYFNLDMLEVVND